MVLLKTGESEAIKAKVREKRTLNIWESCGLLVEGYCTGFQQRRRPSSLSGVNFVRVAGQAVNLRDDNSRSEVRRMLNWIRTGGAFLILGHGGSFGCGAIAAKKAALKGELNEPPEIMRLVEEIDPGVRDLKSPDAEIHNARRQAEKICDDSEFGVLIARKNITVVIGVFCSDDEIEYQAINQREERWNDRKLRREHPKLQALCDQLRNALTRVRLDRIDLSTHYAHAIFAFDPLQMARKMDPFHPKLDIGGFSCVDSRLSPLVAGPRELLNPSPGQTFGFTVERNGRVLLSADDLGSAIYAMRHVGGVDSLKGDGNGHIVCLDADMDAAGQIRDALLTNERVRTGTWGGRTITIAAFDGRSFRMENPAHDVRVDIPYEPRFPILSE